MQWAGVGRHLDAGVQTGQPGEGTLSPVLAEVSLAQEKLSSKIC